MQVRFRFASPLLALSLLALILAACTAPGQVDEPAEAPPTEQGEAAPDAEQASPASDAARLLRIQRVIDLDQQKLVEARRDLDDRQVFFDEVGADTRDLTVRLEEKRKELEDLGEEDTPARRSAVEMEIAGMEDELDLFQTQTDLAFTAETTIRQQIDALEKKLERERRAIDTLRGAVPAEPGTNASAVEAGAVPPTTVPVPISPTAPAPAEGAPRVSRLNTTARIAASREAERLETEFWRAEQEVVEFVKRKESLLEQIGFERVLIETAESSIANLERALEATRVRVEELTVAGVTEDELQIHRGRIPSIEAFLADARDELDLRGEYLRSLNDRLENTAGEESRVVLDVAAKLESAEDAQRALIWLESPLHPTNLTRWVSQRGPRMLLVVVAAAALLFLLRMSVRRVARLAIRQRRGHRGESTNRADTLALSFRSVAGVVILVGALLLVFQEAGVDLRTVLGGAAILGFAVAFGAQNLMRDYFTGFMILMEDQYELGDLVTIGNVTGAVEKVNMRTTVLRDLEGRVHFIPNGEIKTVTNRTYVWGRAVIEVPVGYREDLDRVMEIILEVAEEFCADPEMGAWVTDTPVMLGVDKFTDYGVVIKFMMQTEPDKMFPVRRQMLRRIKARFDAEGIEISVPHRILVQRPEAGD